MNFSEIMAIPIMPRGDIYAVGSSRAWSYSTFPVIVERPLPSTCPGCGASAFTGRRCTYCGRTS